MDKLCLDAYGVEITTSFVRPPLLTLAIGHIVVVYLSRLFHRFWPTSLHFTLLVVVLHEPGPDRRQDDFLETGRTQVSKLCF